MVACSNQARGAIFLKSATMPSAGESRRREADMSFGLFALALLQSAPTQVASAPPKPVKICRESAQVTGSHVRTGARCLTQDQWDQEDARLTRRPVTMQVTGEQGDGNAAPVQPQ
jgi:hypothetical protein